MLFMGWDGMGGVEGPFLDLSFTFDIIIALLHYSLDLVWFGLVWPGLVWSGGSCWVNLAINQSILCPCIKAIDHKP